MKQWLFLEVPKRIFRCVATASLGGTVAPTGGHTRTPLVISQVFSDGGAEDPATGDSAKFERTEGVPTGAVGNLVPHPELHLGGTFFFSAFFFYGNHSERGGWREYFMHTIGSEYVLVAVASVCWFLYNRWGALMLHLIL